MLGRHAQEPLIAPDPRPAILPFVLLNLRSVPARRFAQERPPQNTRNQDQVEHARQD
jgi:hypothetical protein